jgi:hypothetical protein
LLQDLVFNGQVRRIVELALNNRLLGIAAVREDVETGGLMSYGQNLADT